MSVFGKKKSPRASKRARETFHRAEADLREQLEKQVDTIDVQEQTLRALQRNHIADLMFEALSAQRGDR